MARPNVHIVAPTYQEPDHVERFLLAWQPFLLPGDELIIVNANPGDQSSKLIAAYAISENVDFNVIEIVGHPSEFWTGTINRGLDYVQIEHGGQDLLYVTNIDVCPINDIIKNCFKVAPKGERFQVSPVFLDETGRAMSSGFRIISYIFAVMEHPFRNNDISQIAASGSTRVDCCSTRGLLTTVAALKLAGVPDALSLPHYAADHEWSLRLKKRGFVPRICHVARAEVARNNSGLQEAKILTWRQRVNLLLSLKSSYNVKYRVKFVLLSFPKYSWATAILSLVLRALVQVALLAKR